MMKFYCGIDLHAKESYLCVMDEEERIHLRKKAPNDLRIILHELSASSPKPSVVLEATLNWYWLVDGLQEAGFDVKLAHVYGLRLITGAKVKTDRRDASSLAKLLRLNAVPEAYIYPKDERPVRDLLRRRNRMVSLRATAYVSLKQILLQQGVHGNWLPRLQQLDEESLMGLFEHPAIQARLQLELERIRMYSREIRILETFVLDSVSEEPLFELIQTIPGVGKILALTIFYEVGDIARFSEAKHFCSYARVVPGVAQSGAVSRRGKGSKQGNPHLRWAFGQAAALAVRYNGPIRKFPQAHNYAEEHGQPAALTVKSADGCSVRMAFLRTLHEGSSRVGKDRGGSNVVPVRRPSSKGRGEKYSFDMPPLMDASYYTFIRQIPYWPVPRSPCRYGEPVGACEVR